MSTPSLQSLALSTTKTQAAIPVQISNITQRETKGGKPFFEATIADLTHSESVKFWGDTGAYSELDLHRDGGFYFLDAGFAKDSFGLGVNAPVLRQMNPQEQEEFLAGGSELKAQADAEWVELRSTADAISIPQIRIVLTAIMDRHEKEFRAAAAALKNHHNRRGGLLAHTASMLRSAKALAPIYPDVTPDLLFAGLILHDVGKIVENSTGNGLSPMRSEAGEGIGHITIGAITIDRFWRESAAANPEVFKGSGSILVHWIHLIVSHHGTKEFGSPVVPRSPEAFLLHHIDMMDAQMEMVRSAYATNSPEASGLFDAGYPLKTSLLTPLAWDLQ